MAHPLDIETIAPEVIERTFNAVVNKMKLIAIALDSSAHLCYCNDFFLSLTGWTHAEVKGCDYFQRFVPKDLDDMQGVFDDALRDCPDTWHHENEILTRSGIRLLIHWNNPVICGNSGNAIGITSIGQDDSMPPPARPFRRFQSQARFGPRGGYSQRYPRHPRQRCRNQGL